MNKGLIFLVSLILILVFGYIYLTKEVPLSENSLEKDEISYNIDDIIGYIYIANLDMTRVLMQGLDNTFYFNHNYLKVEDKSGEFFLDTFGDLENNKNTIIYTKSNNIDINKLKMNDIVEIKYLDNKYCYKVNSVKKDLILKIFKENEEIDILCKKIMC